MRRLPLYGNDHRAAVELAQPRELNPKCTLCPLSQRDGLKHVCIGADGEPGGLLIVGEGPSMDEDLRGRPFVGRSGDYLRRLVEQWWQGPVAFDNATRCFASRDSKEALLGEAIDACRGYLRQTLIEAQPTRVVLVGARAVQSVLGRSVPPMSVRGGYGWLWNDGRPVPCFMVMHPAAALRNRLVARWFEHDLKHALQRPNPTAPPWGGEARIIDTPKDAEAAVGTLLSAEWVSLDCETFGRPYTEGFRVLSVALCAKGNDDSWVWSRAALEQQDCVDALQTILDSVGNVAQNGKFDSQAMRSGLGVSMPEHHIDTRLVRRIIEPDAEAKLAVQAELVGMGGHKEENAQHVKQAKLVLSAWSKLPASDERTVTNLMDEVWMRRAKELRKAERDAARDLGLPLPSYEGLQPPGRTWTARDDWFTDRVRRELLDGLRPELYSYALVLEEVSLRYNGLDAVSTARLAAQQEEQLAIDERAARVWRQVVQPASRVVEEVERVGIAINQESIAAFSAYLHLRINDVRQRLSEHKFNPDSNKQVADLLFKQLGLPVVSLTDTGAASTDKNALEALKGQHAVVDDLIEWRKLNKLKGTYADGLVPHIQSDGRIHASFNIDGARSGRLSSSTPNMQNSPRAGTPEGKLLRDCFVPTTGMLLVEGDFSQLELRVAAMLSGDEEMRKVFISGEDFHMQVARFLAPIVWKKKPEDVTKEDRSKSKTMVFGILYGMTDGGVVARTGCSFDEAKAIRQTVMGRFRKLDRWIKEKVREAHGIGGAYTWWMGEKFRWRPLLALGDSDDGRRVHAENASYNGPIQGSSNEFCLASLIKLSNWLQETSFPARIVLTVHDSILCECDPQRVDDLIDRMREIMTGWPSEGVPMEVDFQVGESWGSLQKHEKTTASAQVAL